jgi:y4mF family transcriptional regulator
MAVMVFALHLSAVARDNQNLIAAIAVYMDCDLAHIIRQHRQARHLSQSQLAQAAGVGKTVVFDIEHGKPTVQLDTLLKILRALDVRLVFESPSAASTKMPPQEPARRVETRRQDENDALPTHLL